MQYFVYIIYCKDKTFYVGITTNIEKRLKQHNGILKGGAKYTRGRRPVILAYSRSYPSKSDALREEYRLKQLSHIQKEELCNIKILKPIEPR